MWKEHSRVAVAANLGAEITVHRRRKHALCAWKRWSDEKRQAHEMMQYLDFSGAWWGTGVKVLADQTVWSLYLNAMYSFLIGALAFRNPKAAEPLEYAPNLRPAYRNRGISLTEMRAELVREAPFAGVCRDGREYGDGL